MLPENPARQLSTKKYNLTEEFSYESRPIRTSRRCNREGAFPIAPFDRLFRHARTCSNPPALAHEENCEAELAAAIDKTLKTGRLPDPDALKARFSARPDRMPGIHVARPPLAGYGALLAPGGAA